MPNQLSLVQSWFDRPLTEAEIAKATERLAAGQRPPYVARQLDMWARADRKKEA